MFLSVSGSGTYQKNEVIWFSWIASALLKEWDCDRKERPVIRQALIQGTQGWTRKMIPKVLSLKGWERNTSVKASCHGFVSQKEAWLFLFHYLLALHSTPLPQNLTKLKDLVDIKQDQCSEALTSVPERSSSILKDHSLEILISIFMTKFKQSQWSDLGHIFVDYVFIKKTPKSYVWVYINNLQALLNSGVHNWIK